MLIKNPEKQQQLQQKIEQLEQLKADFAQSLKPLAQMRTESKREQAILEAVQNELETHRNECLEATQNHQTPKLDDFIKLKQKEAELLARKEYIDLFLADCEIKEKQYALELSPKRTAITNLLGDIRLTYADQIIDEQIETIANALSVAFYCFKTSNRTKEEIRVRNTTDPLLETSAEKLFLEKLSQKLKGTISNDEFEDEFLAELILPNGLNDFEYVRPTAESRIKFEIEQYYQNLANKLTTK